MWGLGTAIIVNLAGKTRGFSCSPAQTEVSPLEP